LFTANVSKNSCNLGTVSTQKNILLVWRSPYICVWIQSNSK